MARSFSFSASCWSLYVGTRSSQPSGVIIDSSRCSSACSGTWDWTNSVATPGFRPGGEVVDEHLPDVLLQLRGVLVARGQHVPVGDEEEALVLVLQLDPVAQRAVVVAEVQRPGGPHAGEHPAGLRIGAHGALGPVEWPANRAAWDNG